MTTIFTARKRSLGQGDVFTPVCYSVQSGVYTPLLGIQPTPLGRHPPWPDTHPGQTPTGLTSPSPTKMATEVGSTLPTGMNSYLGTRMHSSRMRAIHCKGCLSCHTCSPTMHTLYHAHPLPCTPSTMHIPCNAHPITHTPPACTFP